MKTLSPLAQRVVDRADAVSAVVLTPALPKSAIAADLRDAGEHKQQQRWH